MQSFKERLRKVRTNKNLTQVDMANLLNMSDRGYQKYEYGTSEPNISTLIALADYFDVSLDYLVGRSDDPKRY